MSANDGQPIDGFISPVRSGVGGAGGGGCLVLFGLPFVGAGLFLMAIAFGAIVPDQRPEGAQTLLVGAMGLVFGGAGLFVMGSGIAGSLRLSRLQKRQLQFEGQPWLVDHPWDPSGFETRPLSDFAKGLLFTLFFGLFLSPFNYFVFFADESAPFFAKAIVGVFDLLFLLILGALVHAGLKGLKYGSSRLRYEKFPFHLGETLEVSLEGADRLAGADEIEVALRCVRQKQVKQGESTTTAGWLLHEEKRVLKPAEVGLPRGGARILQLGRPSPDRYPLHLAFDVPPDARPARLMGIGEEGVFWEVHVKAKAPGLDYDEHFLVPVYDPA